MPWAQERESGRAQERKAASWSVRRPIESQCRASVARAITYATVLGVVCVYGSE